MKTHILHAWDTIRNSYWFVPGIFVCVAILFSVAVPYIDGRLPPVHFPDWIQTTTGSAQVTLSAIGGAMTAVIGTVFSITIVILSLTSQQFGPRLLRTFMHDLVTQVTLGFLLATALYSILILRVVEKLPDTETSLHLSVMFSVFLFVCSTILIIIFIHHIAILIQAPRIVETVALDLDRAIVRIFPEELTDNPLRGSKGIERESVFSEESLSTPIVSTQEGYIQAFNTDSILVEAEEHDLVFGFFCRPGDFIAQGEVIARVRGVPEEKTDTLTFAVNDSIIVGMRRTPRQDLECAINELVEVAVRSLSPGINDPFTAMCCVDRLGASLMRLARRDLSSHTLSDANGVPRIFLKDTSFPAILNAAFNQIRQYAHDSIAVMARLLETLGKIGTILVRVEDMEAVLAHGEMIWRQGQNVLEENDRESLETRFKKLKNIIISRKSEFHQFNASE